MYLAIDIETTGLDPEKNQVIEIGAVFNDWTKPVIDCPTFHTYVEHPIYCGDAYALAMNKRVFDMLAQGLGQPDYCATYQFTEWLSELCEDKKVHLLGQNVGSFDLQFLKKLSGFPGRLMSHRHLDTASIYATVDGMPSLGATLEEVARDFGLDGLAHEALFDARVALAAARRHWGFEV